jgi:hypothetical protein
MAPWAWQSKKTKMETSVLKHFFWPQKTNVCTQNANCPNTPKTRLKTIHVFEQVFLDQNVHFFSKNVHIFDQILNIFDQILNIFVQKCQICRKQDSNNWLFWTKKAICFLPHVRNNFQKLKKSIFLGASLFGRKTALIEKTHCSLYIFHYFINRLFIKTNILYNNSSLKWLNWYDFIV